MNKKQSPDNDKKQAKREKLYSLLGELPPREAAITVQKIAEEEHEKFILEKLILDLNTIEPVPAYFVKPKKYEGKLPVILFNHSHGGYYTQGKDELVYPISPYMGKPCYAEQLTQLGYGAICIDAWGFGERRGKTESEIFKEMLWTGARHVGHDGL